MGTLFYWYSMYYICFMSRDIYELIEKMIDKKVKGADTYINNGSRWLIFTDEKKWIFELTKEGTLWYNYYFFERIFKLISLNVVENQHHITKWVENFIQNGVKETKHNPFEDGLAMEEAIQNGVKHTEYGDWLDGDERLDDIIENGIKETKMEEHHRLREVVQTVKDGVKETHWKRVDNHPTFVDGIIEKIT